MLPPLLPLPLNRLVVLPDPPPGSAVVQGLGWASPTGSPDRGLALDVWRIQRQKTMAGKVLCGCFRAGGALLRGGGGGSASVLSHSGPSLSKDWALGFELLPLLSPPHGAELQGARADWGRFPLDPADWPRGPFPSGPLF